MTLEEQIEDLKNQVEATNSKNSELLKELRIAKNKNKELDFDTYNKVLEENDTLKSELSKTKGELNLKAKDLEKLSGTLTEKENYLNSLKLSNTIKEQLTKHNIHPDDADVVEAILEKNFKLVDGEVKAGDKDVDTFMAEYMQGKGQRYTLAPANSGTGATGSNGNMSASTPKRSEMSHQQKGEYIKANGQEAYLNLPN